MRAHVKACRRRCAGAHVHTQARTRMCQRACTGPGIVLFFSPEDADDRVYILALRAEGARAAAEEAGLAERVAEEQHQRLVMRPQPKRMTLQIDNVASLKTALCISDAGPPHTAHVIRHAHQTLGAPHQHTYSTT